MRFPIESSSLFSLYNSFDKVASALIKTRPDLFEKEGKANDVVMRSLGAKIGELNRGKSTWWIKREKETEALTKLLDIRPHALGLHQKTGRHIFPLSAFPDFPPLNLMRENCWNIAAPTLVSDGGAQTNEGFTSRTKPTLDGWLSPQGAVLPNRGKKIEWLYVPDITEYQLLSRKLEATERIQFASCTSLRELFGNRIEHLRNPQPLILAIDGKPQVDHLESLITYREGGPLLVISPSQLPDLWSREKGETDQPSEINGELLIKPTDVNVWAWTLLPDWRQQLLRWLEQRMRRLGIQTSFRSSTTQELLKKFDPSGKWFICVEDVLILCQAVNESRSEELHTTTGSNGDVRLLHYLLFNRDYSSLALIRPMIERRWKRWDLAWEGELDEKTWIDMANDLCSFDTMLTQKLIVKSKTGVDFERPTLIRLLLRSQLMAALEGSDLAAWAPACFDAQRRPLVDAALDSLDIEQLERVAIQLTEAPVLTETIGAGEALFTAIGRRIIREEDIGAKLPLLADHFLRQMTWIDGLVYPCSRPLASVAQQLEWICVCWAWSLLPSPSTNLPPNWLFPGWNQVSLHTLPPWINIYASSNPSEKWEHIAIPKRDFLSVVTRWLASHKAPPSYEYMPQLFNAGMLARAAAGQWTASSYWWWGLQGDPIEEDTLLHQVVSTDASVNRRTLHAWLPSLVKHLREKSQQKMFHSDLIRSSIVSTRSGQEQGNSSVLTWLMRLIDQNNEDLLTILSDDEDRKFMMKYPAMLPLTVRRQLLRSLAKDFPTEWKEYELANLLLDYGPETGAEMELLLDNIVLGNQAAVYLWAWAPHKAEMLLHKNWTISRAALSRLIKACPIAHIGVAVRLLSEDPTLLTNEERPKWVRSRLPDARQYASDMMCLLKMKTAE